ncbi:MAG: hypothetical protein ACTSUE_16430 [Promethearchaeota archaeon]
MMKKPMMKKSTTKNKRNPDRKRIQASMPLKYAIVKGLGPPDKNLRCHKSDKRFSFHIIYLRVCIVMPLDSIENAEKLGTQIEEANACDVCPLGKVSKIPGTMYISAPDVIQNIGLRSIPNNTDSNGLPLYPRVHLPSDEHTNNIFNQYMNFMDSGMRYNRKRMTYIKLSDLRLFLSRKGSNRRVTFQGRKDNLLELITANKLANSLHIFWKRYPKVLVAPLASYVEEVSRKTKNDRVYYESADLNDSVTHIPMVEQRYGDDYIASGDPASGDPASGDLVSGDLVSEEENQQPKISHQCIFREHTYTSVEQEEALLYATLNVRSQRKVPIRHRVIKCVIPIFDKTPFPSAGELPNGIMLEFACVPFNGKNTQSQYRKILKNKPLVSADPEAILEEHEKRLGSHISSQGNIHLTKTPPGVWGIWSPLVRSGAAQELLTWDVKFADLEYRMDPGVAFIPSDKTVKDPKPLDLSYMPENTNEDITAKNLTQRMYLLASTKKVRDAYSSSMRSRRMYVPCISVDDLLRSGILPSVSAALKKLSLMILGINDVEMSAFLFPRVAREEVIQRKKAAAMFRGGHVKRMIDVGNTRRFSFNITYKVPIFEEERKTDIYKKIEREVKAKIAYYETAEQVEQIKKDEQRKRNKRMVPNEKSTTIMKDVRRLMGKDVNQEDESDDDEVIVTTDDGLITSVVERLSGKEDAKEVLDYYSDFSTSWNDSEDSRSGFGTSEDTTPRKTNNGKLFQVSRKFTVRRVDDLSTMSCTVAGQTNWRPQAYICFPALEHYYTVPGRNTKGTKTIHLPIETHRWIPIWLFPFVLRMCQGDPLYKAMGGTESITYFVDMFDAAIVHAATSKSRVKGAIPVETAKLCRSLLRATAEFFEIEERSNTRDLINKHEKKLTGAFREIKECKELFQKQIELNATLTKREVCITKELVALKEYTQNIQALVERVHNKCDILADYAGLDESSSGESSTDEKRLNNVRKRKTTRIPKEKSSTSSGRKKARKTTETPRLILEGGLLDL